MKTEFENKTKLIEVNMFFQRPKCKLSSGELPWCKRKNSIRKHEKVVLPEQLFLTIFQ